MTVMLISTGALRLLSFVSQLVLGYYLDKSDFGVFAIAASVWTLILVARDGGGRHLLVQMGAEAYPGSSGPIFWMAMVFSLAIGAGLALLTPVIAWAYDDPRLIPMLLVLAICVPLGTPGAILATRLRIDLNFKSLASLNVLMGVMRFGGSMGLAAILAGTESSAMSFVLPLIGVALLQNVYTLLSVDDRPWMRPMNINRWPTLFRDGKWLILGALGSIMVRLGPYAVIGLFLPKPILGVFYFGIQIVRQTGQMIGANLESVFLPVFSRLQGDAPRLAHAVYRSIRTVAILILPLGFWVGAVYPSLEFLAWGSKWMPTVLPVSILTVGYTLFALHFLPKTVLIAMGHFRASTSAMILTGAGLMATCGVTAFFYPTANSLSLAASGYMMIAIGLWAIWTAKVLHLHLRRIVGAVIPILIISATGWIWSRLIDATLLAAIDPALRFVLAAATSTLIMGLLLRWFVPGDLRDALKIAPAYIRPIMSRVLFLSTTLLDEGEPTG